MDYSEARCLFLQLCEMPESVSDITTKYSGYVKLHRIVADELGDVLVIVKSEYAQMESSRYVYQEYESCVGRSLVHDVLEDAYEPDEHSNYKNILVYMRDTPDLIYYRDSQLRSYRQFISAKWKPVRVLHNAIRQGNGFYCDKVETEYDSMWEYSANGSYNIYTRYKGKPEFDIMMKLIEHNSTKGSALEMFNFLHLLKELDEHIKKTETLMRLFGVSGDKEGTACGQVKLYKLDYELVQELFAFCERQELYVEFAFFEHCVRTADFKKLIAESKRSNCWKCMLMHISNAVKGGKEEQHEWYEHAARSIGISKSESRRGQGNLPVGFDDELRLIVEKHNRNVSKL